MKIAVAGIGYVGLSLAVLLAQHNEVEALDIVPEKVDLINQHRSPIRDREIEDYLKNRPLALHATLDAEEAFRGADVIILATPTDYHVETNSFDTSSLETVLKSVERLAPGATVVIKSTVPIGYLEEVRKRFALPHLIFSPEFLREGKALYDNLHPSRIIVGVPAACSGELQERAEAFAELLRQGAEDKDIPVLILSGTEAECVKLFANTYLAMRVAFFNELDSYAAMHDLDSAQIIRGVGLDPRIGSHYNNPSFGYGGYCLPKDTRQLLANFKGTPNDIITAVVKANDTRIRFIADQILERSRDVVGIYRLTMKSGSDNFRSSSIQKVMRYLREGGRRCIVYEPSLKEPTFQGCEVIQDLAEFAERSEIIVANRKTNEVSAYADKLYTRDLFEEN